MSIEKLHTLSVMLYLDLITLDAIAGLLFQFFARIFGLELQALSFLCDLKL